jgi:hypothetical protein
VDLRRDAQAHGASRAGGVAGGSLVGFHELGPAVAWRLVARDHDGVAAGLAAQPPHQSLVRGRTVVGWP